MPDDLGKILASMLIGILIGFIIGVWVCEPIDPHNP